MTALFVPLLCCILLFSSSHALIQDKSVSLRALNDFEQFGFDAGGTISMTTWLSPIPTHQNVSIFLCTDKQFDLLSSYSQVDDIGFCNSPPHTCEYMGDYKNDLNNYRVQTKNRYHLVLLQCGSTELVRASIHYTLLNPGGVQLPLGEIPLPHLYIVITCIWTVLVVLCGIIWIKNRQHVVVLHGLLCTVGVLKQVVVTVALAYWHVYEASGQDVVQLKYLQSFIYALSETAFFCSLLLISKGWRVTRSNLPPSEVRTISVALVLLLSTLLFFSFYNDGYYFLSLMIMYFFMLPKIFTSITRNTRALHTHMLLARYANAELNTAPILAKIKMFKTLRTAVILYLGSILIISSMKIIMWWFLVWVTFMVSELVTIVMVVAVCILTRPRENGVFSPRSYFESGAFPLLNMQQFDHFDELFGDQIWDPDLVFANGGLPIASGSGNQPLIDVSEAIVIEYPVPVPSSSSSSEDQSIASQYYYPRLAIATLDKEKEKAEGGSGNGGEDDESGVVVEKGTNSLRRRGTTSFSNSPLSPSTSSTALLASSLSLSTGSSSSPLLVSSSSRPDYDRENFGIELDEVRGAIETTNTATQTSPPPTPRPSTPDLTILIDNNNNNEIIHNNNNNSIMKNIRRNRIYSKGPHGNNNNNSANHTTINIGNEETNKNSNTNNNNSNCNTTTTTTTTTAETSSTSLSRIDSSDDALASPIFNSSSSLLSSLEKGERTKWDVEDDEGLM